MIWLKPTSCRKSKELVVGWKTRAMRLSWNNQAMYFLIKASVLLLKLNLLNLLNLTNFHKSMTFGMKKNIIWLFYCERSFPHLRIVCLAFHRFAWTNFKKSKELKAKKIVVHDLTSSFFCFQHITKPCQKDDGPLNHWYVKKIKKLQTKCQDIYIYKDKSSKGFQQIW